MFSKSLVILLIIISGLSCKLDSRSLGTIGGSGGVIINYMSRGDGDTTLLFVHGWCINKDYWDPQFKHFCPNYKVVAIDLPGFGESGKNRSDWNFDNYAADIHAVIEELKLKNVILIGHSMSGDIILNVGNKYPDDVIALVGVDNLHDPGGPMNEVEQQQTDSFFSRLSQNFDGTVNGNMKASLFQPATDASIVTRVMNDVYNCDSVIAIDVLKSMTIVWQKEKQMMQNLSDKLFLINSDVNPVKLDSLKKYCRKGCEVITVQGTGHYPMIEKPGEFNAAIEKVIKEIGKASK